MKTASWVIRNKTTGTVLVETFDAKTAAAWNAFPYESVPILDYLVELNQKQQPNAD